MRSGVVIEHRQDESAKPAPLPPQPPHGTPRQVRHPTADFGGANRRHGQKAGRRQQIDQSFSAWRFGSSGGVTSL